MSDPTREPSAPSALFARSHDVSRRTLMGAAWSAPVVLAAVATPLAAASGGGGGQPDASLFWTNPNAYIDQRAQLQLVVPTGSGGVGSNGTLLFTATGGGSIPNRVFADNQTGWHYTRNDDDTLGTMTSPAFGVLNGVNVFSVTWSSDSQPGTILATWQNDQEPGSLAATVALGIAPLPTLEWLTNPVAFEGTTTLRLVVPAEAAGIGVESYVFSGEYIGFSSNPAFPAGTQIEVPDGWVSTVLTETDPNTGEEISVPVLKSAALAVGTYEFVYTIGSGPTPVTPKVVLASFQVSGLIEASLSIVPA